MLKRKCSYSRVFIVVALFTISACGGGGGGGGGKSSDGVRVFHGVLDGSPLDVFSSAKEESLGTVRFAGSTGFQSVPNEAQTISLGRAELGPTVLTTSLEAESGGRYSILVYGDLDNFGLRQNSIVDRVPEPEEGKAFLRVLHATVGAAGIDATAAGVAVSDNLSFGSGSDYAAVPAGDVVLRVFRSVDNKLLSTIQITLLEGESYTVLTAGEVDYFVRSSVFEY